MAVRRGFSLGPKKYFIFPPVAISLTLLLIIWLNLYLSVEIEPTAFAALGVEGGPDSGEYRFTIALLNQNGTNGPADGYISLKIISHGGEEIYSTNFRVKSEEFREIRSGVGAGLIGFSWSVPVANLSASNGEVRGTAKVVFLSLYGHSIAGTLEIDLPR
ncbi:MAG: hypothetical protein WHS82_04190 [Candidatus Methanosuratincola sp.]